MNVSLVVISETANILWREVDPLIRNYLHDSEVNSSEEMYNDKTKKFGMIVTLPPEQVISEHRLMAIADAVQAKYREITVIVEIETRNENELKKKYGLKVIKCDY